MARALRRNPGDDRLRDLERLAVQGDPAAAAAWRVEALRRGVDAWPDRDPLRDPIPGDVVDMTYHGHMPRTAERRRYEVLALGPKGVQRRVLSVMDATGQPRAYPHIPTTKSGALRVYAGMPGWVDWIKQSTWCSQCAPGRRTGDGGTVVFRAPSMYPPPAGWRPARRRRRRVSTCTCGSRGPDSGGFDPHCPLHGTAPPLRMNPLVDSDVLAQALYDAGWAAREIPLSEVNLSTSDRGHPVVDEPERYRWFLIPKFKVGLFGLRLDDLLRDAGPYASHEQWRHDKIVDHLRRGPAWPAVVAANGVLVDGFHRVTANRTLRRSTMPVVVAVDRSGSETWDEMWLDAQAAKRNPPRGDDELRRLERRAAQGDLADERAYHRALERRGVALDRGLMLPRLEVVDGIWTPRAEVLCYGCHGPVFRVGRLTPEQFAEATASYPESEVGPGGSRPWSAITTCDRCNRRIALSDKVAHEHELVKRLREALRGTDAETRMEQTGGMCSGLSVTWPQNARGGFAFLVEDEERDGLFHMTTHPIAAEFWNGDATPLHVVSGDATDVVSAIIDAVRS